MTSIRADSLSHAGSVIKSMAGFGHAGVNIEIMEFLTPFYLFMFFVAVIGSTTLPRKLWIRFRENLGSTVAEYAKMCCSLGLLVLCFMQLASTSYNPFIYFRF